MTERTHYKQLYEETTEELDKAREELELFESIHEKYKKCQEERDQIREQFNIMQNDYYPLQEKHKALHLIHMVHLSWIDRLTKYLGSEK